ncbi:murein hydrolase activator EnvC family protein [Streptomyces flavalbus]|uniref:Murein hydrolase activator EnvC family protein n=1 Tax=Streptomyces flavalbus TaxID=2665155 RepID=A0ABW2WDE4_9ACTN
MSGRAKSTRWPGSPPEVYGTDGAPGDAAVHNRAVLHSPTPCSASPRDATTMHPRLLLALFLPLLATLPLLPAPTPPVATTWPLTPRPPVLRGWDPPPTPYARGHRGVDLRATPGAPVRAVAPGRVTYAGRVAGRGVITVELHATGNPPLRTTYEPVTPTVHKGDEVSPGQPLGTLTPTTPHCPTSCLHWGLRRGATYLNPLTLLPPHLRGSGASRLLPLS